MPFSIFSFSFAEILIVSDEIKSADILGHGSDAR